MAGIIKKLFSPHFSSLMKRNLQISATNFNFEEFENDGKTTVTILNKNFDYGLMIDNMSEQGFVLNNGIRTIGPMIIFPKTMLGWNIAESRDMNEESFSLLLHMEPKLDIVVIGLDGDFSGTEPFIKNVREIFKKHEINVEILSTWKASSTFNFLNAENRYVAAALIPPKLAKTKSILLRNVEKKTESLKDNEDAEEIGKIEEHKNEDGSKILNQISVEKLKFKVESEKDEVDLFDSRELKNIDSGLLAEDKTVRESFKIRKAWKKQKEPWEKLIETDKNEKKEK